MNINFNALGHDVIISITPEQPDIQIESLSEDEKTEFPITGNQLFDDNVTNHYALQERLNYHENNNSAQWVIMYYRGMVGASYGRLTAWLEDIQGASHE